MAEIPLVNFTQNIPQFEGQNWTTNSDFRWSSYEGLHTAANKSLHWIFPNIDDYAGFRLDPNDLTYFNTGDDGNVDVDEMIWDNKGPLIFGIIGLMFAFILTVVGIGWCVVQCCSCCASKKAKLRAKNDSRKNNRLPKIACGIIMIIWRVLFVTFLIALFVSNEQFKDAIEELPQDIDNGVVDAETFISLTQDQIDAVFKKSYDDLADVLLEIIGQGGGANFNAAEYNLRSQEAAKSYNRAKEQLNDLDTKMTGTGDQEIVSMIRSLQSTLTDIQSNVDSTKIPINDLVSLPEEIVKIREELKGNADSLNGALGDVPINQTREDIKEIEEEFNRAKGPAFHSINGLNLFLLLIIVILTVGAILGIFSKKIGTPVVNCGLLTIFITVGIIWIFTIGVFMLAGGLAVVLPGAFFNVASNGSLVQPLGRAESGYVVPGYAAILQNCKNSESAFITFDLAQVYNISAIRDLPDRLQLTPDTTGSRSLTEQSITAAKQMSEIKELSYKLWIAQGTESKFQTLQTDIESLEKEVSSILRNAEIVQKTRGAAEEIDKHVRHYTNFVEMELLENVGSCEPLYNVLTSTLHVFSYKVGSPIGSYWFSLNFLLFLFYPIVITAIFTLRL